MENHQLGNLCFRRDTVLSATQCYQLVHYIREEFIKAIQQYFQIDDKLPAHCTTETRKKKEPTREKMIGTLTINVVPEN